MSKITNRPAKDISMSQYIEQSNDPIVRDSISRYKRGDIDYFDALERIVVLLLAEKLN